MNLRRAFDRSKPEASITLTIDGPLAAKIRQAAGRMGTSEAEAARMFLADGEKISAPTSEGRRYRQVIAGMARRESLATMVP